MAFVRLHIASGMQPSAKSKIFWFLRGKQADLSLCSKVVLTKDCPPAFALGVDLSTHVQLPQRRVNSQRVWDAQTSACLTWFQVVMVKKTDKQWPWSTREGTVTEPWNNIFNRETTFLSVKDFTTKTARITTETWSSWIYWRWYRFIWIVAELYKDNANILQYNHSVLSKVFDNDRWDSCSHFK